MQGDLQEYLGEPKARPTLTLDQVMACETPDFQAEYDDILSALNAFIMNRDVQGSSTEQRVLPAVKGVYNWLITFEKNMRFPESRLQGTLWTRACFVENGMKSMLAFGEATTDEIAFLKAYQEKCIRFIEVEQSGLEEGKLESGKRERPEKLTSQLIEVAKGEMDHAGRMIKLLQSTWLKVLNRDSQHLALMYTWFNALVDLIPETYKSYNSVLTRDNVETLYYQ